MIGGFVKLFEVFSITNFPCKHPVAHFEAFYRGPLNEKYPLAHRPTIYHKWMGRFCNGQGVEI